MQKFDKKMYTKRLKNRIESHRKDTKIAIICIEAMWRDLWDWKMRENNLLHLIHHSAPVCKYTVERRLRTTHKTYNDMIDIKLLPNLFYGFRKWNDIQMN